MNQIGVCGFIRRNLTFYPLSVLERGTLFTVTNSTCLIGLEANQAIASVTIEKPALGQPLIMLREKLKQ